MKASLLFFLLSIVAASAADLFTDRVYDKKLTGALMLSAGVPPDRLPHFSGTQYAEVSRLELVRFDAVVSYRLFKRYQTKWNSRFACFARAWHFISEASLELATQKWRLDSSDSCYERPAVIAVSYLEGGATGRGHTVLLILTDEGPVWWDPAKAGAIPQPTAVELATIFYPQA